MTNVAPDQFCVLPVMGYWEIDGKPVSSQEAQNGLNSKAVWKQSEVAKNLHRHVGYIRED